MKALWLSVTGCICVLWAGAVTVVAAPAEEVRVGDPVEIVREVLGKPRSYMGCGTYEILLYERGRVEIRDGKVTSLELVSAEQAARQRMAAEERRRARDAARADQRERLRAEGVALKRRVANDPAFERMTAANQLSFWTTFVRKYPDVSADLEHAKAVEELEREAEIRRERERAQAMAMRAAAAERRAEEAERRTAEARRRENRYVSYAPPFVDYAPLVAGHPYVWPVAVQPVHACRQTAPVHSRRTEAQGGVRHNYTVDTRRSDLTFQQIEKIRSYPKSPFPTF